MYLFILRNTGMKLLGHVILLIFLVLGSFCVVLTPQLTQGSYLQFSWAKLPHE